MKLSTSLLLLSSSSLSVSASLIEDNGKAGDVKINDLPFHFHESGSKISEIFHRDLQQIPCDGVIGLASVEEVKQIVSGTFANFVANAAARGFDLPEATSIITEMVPLLEYDIQMMKVCMRASSR